MRPSLACPNYPLCPCSQKASIKPHSPINHILGLPYCRTATQKRSSIDSLCVSRSFPTDAFDESAAQGTGVVFTNQRYQESDQAIGINIPARYTYARGRLSPRPPMPGNPIAEPVPVSSRPGSGGVHRGTGMLVPLGGRPLAQHSGSHGT